MSDADSERYDRDTVTDAELEQEFRDHPITPNERFLLCLLDAERARADAADAKAQALRRVALDITPHLYEGGCPDRIDGPDLRDPDCPACALL